MNKLQHFLAAVVITCTAVFPISANADIDELDVTMEVLDNVGDLDGEILEMRGPESTDDDFIEDDELDADGEVGSIDADDLRADEEDDFDHDDDFQSELDEEHAEDESDFDEGDDIETDEIDEEEMEEDEDDDE